MIIITYILKILEVILKGIWKIIQFFIFILLALVLSDD